MRYFIEFAYNGKNYCGWQYQPHSPSVQETLNKALSTLLRTEIDVLGAGRTDAGVHAKQMYAHFDFYEVFDTDLLIHKLNAFLPKDIVIYRFIPVADDAHARFDAVSRTYEYHIHTYKDAFDNEGSWYNSHPLDVEAMNKAAQVLFEYKDFKSFSKTHTDVKTFNCDIKEAFWVQQGTKLVFTISADRFLRNMVRAIVGTLVQVGLGKSAIDDFRAVIESRDRGKAGFSVPAHGLYLTKVIYPYL
ncbi:tRNA pseudouridine(38-40) synthase TruA [Flavobacterium salilacus subsp. salilacus]|uniref:tRNA pseudouridine(38-40) synthase TruA n=1 Tax=Flavobacterium TaxID=237 RepID=UPI00107563FD|nr:MULTISPECIES: tRNA pseudouridine(38-40) synthase TruA [Flavobacterium]KAF2516279.1 tRNA pseudouridine(38-40) synthase TruA [Flavobacterium salilacus subsp. salilacus]MBE1613809.1 tRNA pseudouridine(38-40) synthase TruA [Flavobacterium sp. SaA2.13]